MSRRPAPAPPNVGPIPGGRYPTARLLPPPRPPASAPLREALEEISREIDQAVETLARLQSRVGAALAGLDRPAVRSAQCPHTNLVSDVSGGPVQCEDCKQSWLRREDVPSRRG